MQCRYYLFTIIYHLFAYVLHFTLADLRESCSFSQFHHLNPTSVYTARYTHLYSRMN